MMQQSPVVVAEPRAVACEASVLWDDESSVLSLSINCQLPLANMPESTAGEINRLLHIEDASYRIVVGNIDMLLDTTRRLVSLDIRTNPRNWRHESLIPMMGEPTRAFLRFLADFDENNIASCDIPVTVLRDPSCNELSLRLGEYAASKWILVAEGLVAGLTLDDHLCELRLLGFDLP
jgi:hypothetical protein